MAVGLTLTACTTPEPIEGGLAFATEERLAGDVAEIEPSEEWMKENSTATSEPIEGMMESAPETKETPEWMSDISLEGETDCDAGECD